MDAVQSGRALNFSLRAGGVTIDGRAQVAR
jgi:hypothetical protein